MPLIFNFWLTCESLSKKVCKKINMFSKIATEIVLQFKIRLLKIWVVNSSNLHWNRLNLDNWVVFGPCTPLNSSCMQFSTTVMDAIQVCETTLVEPPASVVMEVTATLHWLTVDQTSRVAPIVINIWGAKRHGILVILFSEALECITCIKWIIFKEWIQRIFIISDIQNTASRNRYQLFFLFVLLKSLSHSVPKPCEELMGVFKWANQPTWKLS